MPSDIDIQIGELLKKLRHDSGYVRSRRMFVEDNHLEWTQHVQRDLEEGRTKLSVDRLQDLIYAGLIKERSDLHRQLLELLEARERVQSIITDVQPPLDQVDHYTVESDPEDDAVWAFEMDLRDNLNDLLFDQRKATSDLEEKIREMYFVVSQALVSAHPNRWDWTRKEIAHVIQDNTLLNDVLSRLMIDVDKRRK